MLSSYLKILRYEKKESGTESQGVLGKKYL